VYMRTASDQVLVRLTPSTTRALDEHCIQERPVWSRGAIVRRAVEEYLNRQGNRNLWHRPPRFLLLSGVADSDWMPARNEAPVNHWYVKVLLRTAQPVANGRHSIQLSYVTAITAASYYAGAKCQCVPLKRCA
jgi:hypothetical protein